jgi:hypothetical protein
MQLQELLHTDLADLPSVDGAPAAPQFGTLFIQLAFQNIVTPIVYIIGFVALWFHMNHGFWSMFHTIGWDNNVWINRFKKIACWWSSIVVALFVIQAVVFTVQANNNYYTTAPELQEQYGEFWAEKAQSAIDDFQSAYQAKAEELRSQNATQQDAQQAQVEFFTTKGTEFVKVAEIIDSCATKQCPNASNQELAQIRQMKQQIQQTIQFAESIKNQH